jgi:uncharacterized protein YuzE
LPEDEWLPLARERVPELPVGKVWLTYQPDVDSLYIRFKECANPTRTDDDMERGLIFDYEDRQLVGIEVLDLYGVFAS